MNTVILLSAVFVLTYSASITRPKRLVLEELIKDLNVSIPENLENKLVPVVLKKECNHEDFCKAEHVLLQENHSFMKNWNIVRTLNKFNEKKSCTVEHTADEVQLRNLLRHLLLCAQKFYSKLSID